jgi:predicted dehydrogenase
VVTDLRWGIIGCGDVTEVKSGPALAGVAGSTVQAVMRRTASLAEDYARRHGVPRWSTDADDLLMADDIDAIYIATHPNTHREYALRAIAAGKPVLVEKPMAMDASECRDMIDAARSAGVPLWVAYYRRSLPRFHRVRDVLESGVLGEIRAVQCQRFSPHREGSWQLDGALVRGGWFVDAACHTLDILDWLLGPLSAVSGLRVVNDRESQHPSTVLAQFMVDDGRVPGNGVWVWDSGVDIDAVTIVGTKGTVQFCVSAPRPIIVTTARSQESIEAADPPHVHSGLVADIVEELRGGPPAPSTGESALRTAAVIDSILERAPVMPHQGSR